MMFGPPVYLVDFSVYKPPDDLRVDVATAQWDASSWSMYSDEMREFTMKVFDRSGISPTNAYLPAAIHPSHATEARNGIAESMDEARMVMIGAVTDLLEKTGTRPTDIDILITNCSIFCPTPSLASMLVNHFKMRRNIQSYHLGGMGCGNGVVAIGLVRDLLRARPGATALFVPAEITSYAFYGGRDRQYMVANAIFRMGGAALLLSSAPSARCHAKYSLTTAERVHTGGDDAAYACMAWQPDAQGINGVYLGKDVVTHAAAALRECLTAVAPRVMTWRQLAEAAATIFQQRVLGMAVPDYVPDFAAATVKHFAVHAGGYAVLKGVQTALKLPVSAMMPSFAALRDYGNTSCSSTYYALAYLESTGVVAQGDTVMQLGMGGGMKAGVNVWRALRDTRSAHRAWAHLGGVPLTEADLPRPITDANKGSTSAKEESAAAAAVQRPAISVFAIPEGVEGEGHH